MPVKKGLHRVALGIDETIQGIIRRRASGPPVLDAYRGYATPEGVVLRGRVLVNLRRTSPDPGQSRWRNLREMVSLFLTSEVADVQVRAVTSGVEAVSDSEGYVTLEVPGEVHPPGWTQVMVEIVEQPASRIGFRALVPSKDARVGVISDIDDTMLETGAYSLARNLWTTFTGSTRTRRVFPDAVIMMSALSREDQNPVYYVSSSPWNLHAFLDKVFHRAGLTMGPMFLRDIGINETRFFASSHGDHKGSAIDRIMAANPDLGFVMVGDTGQHDAEAYLAACQRHPGRVSAVILREPRPGPGNSSRIAIEAMERLGILVVHGPDFTGVLATLERRGVAF